MELEAAGGEIDEEEIDNLRLPKAIRLAKLQQIDISSYKKLEDIKCALKRFLLPERQRREDVVRDLSSSAAEDAGQRQELSGIFDALICTINDLTQKNDPMLKQLHQSFPNVMSVLSRERDKLAKETVKCPIMVLGETGAGKSSFINLILGCELLPYSLLSNTNTICEIQYGDQHSVILHPHEYSRRTEQIICDSFSELQAILKEKIQKNENGTDLQKNKNTTEQIMYKRAEIFLPNDLLQTGLLIVDSPGIADTREMTSLVLEYLIDACAFIYVINSANAGGVAPERLQDLLRKVIDKAFRDEQDFRPECALFVCNKWDQVQPGEREAVKKDTIHKLTGSSTGWPGCQESQIYTLSTREASFIQNTPDKFVVGQFACLLKEIMKLVPKSREILLTKSIRLVKQVVDKSLFIIDHNLSDAKLPPEEKGRRTVTTIDNLAELKSEVCQFFDHEKSYLRRKLDVITEKLSKHLLLLEVKDRICNVSEYEIDDTKEWKEVTVMIRSLLYDKIAAEIQRWEAKSHELERLGQETSERFMQKFPDFDHKLHLVEQKFQSGKSGDHSAALPTDEVPFVPMNITRKFDNLNIGFKVLIGVTFAPVFLIGALVRLPVWGVKELKRKIDSVMLEKDYGSDRIKAMRKYAESTLNSTTDPYKMRPVLEEEVQPLLQYLEQQRLKVLNLIDVDIAIIEKKKEDLRRRESIIESYSHLRGNFREHGREILYFYKMKMPVPSNFISNDCIQDVEKVSGGIVQEIFKGTMTSICISGLDDSHKHVIIRKNKFDIRKDNILGYLKEEEAYSNRRFVHHLPCLGFVRQDTRIWQVLTMHDCTLREFLQKTCVGQGKPKHHTLYTCMDQVVSGLEFLHRKDLVHIDLSLDTILVDSDTKIRLINVNSPCKLSAELLPHKSTSILPYAHFHPNILMDPESNVYRSLHDMYSVGIIMWEVWTNRRAFQDKLNTQKSIKTLGDFAKSVSLSPDKLALDIEDGKGIVEVNIWDECIIQCQKGELKACEWRDKMSNNKYDYRFAQCPLDKKP
ncbi:hypothetical protein FSP39_019770 [Pinctada imbricata]|uniref:Protein kinase domain-containing protein n=1 Tax=Pinctada imbricata TaxID=66713 RepID=A0AA89BRI3_PINIB|nr:hypothetical protein FSP39_019770 [Pinctada imbricata]